MGAAPQRVGDPLGVVLTVHEKAIDLAAKSAPGEGVLGVPADPDDAIAVDLRHHAARIEAVERAGRLDDAEHQGQSLPHSLFSRRSKRGKYMLAGQSAMDFEYAQEHEAFRKEFRDWLASNLPPELCLDDPADDRVASDRETFERRRAWQKTMHAAGWVGITWPKEYGGRGAGLIERVIWDEEYAAARAPVLPGSMGLNLVGPTIIHWGTDAQKHRHLSAILSGEEVWAQGFSEPGAGSDLAGLRTRAEEQGDRSEERRVGKECRSRRWTEQKKKRENGGYTAAEVVTGSSATRCSKYNSSIV